MTAFIPTQTAAVTSTVCEAFEVQSGEHGSGSTLTRLSLTTGEAAQSRKLDYEVNAIGYARAQDLVYGIGHSGHMVTIDHAGTPADRGPVRGVPLGDLALATAGAVGGNTLYVRLDDRLFAIDIAPASPTYLTVVRVIRMRPSPPVESVDDFAVDDADGLLYGVSTSYDGPAAIVSIDPVQGTVKKVATPAGLPDHGNYGSVVIDSNRTLYAINNEFQDRSRLYSVPHGGAATQVASWPEAETTDAAGCLGVPAPPPTAAPKSGVPPVVPAPKAPVVTTTAVPPARPAPVKPTPASKQAVVAKSLLTPKKMASTPLRRAVASADNNEAIKQRRWATATVILLIGGGAAASAAGRRARRSGR